MRFYDFGSTDTRTFLRQIVEWSQKRVSIQDNMDMQEITAHLNTSETVVQHNLGRIPTGLIPVLKYPNSIKGIEFTKASDASKLYLKRDTAGECTFLIY